MNTIQIRTELHQYIDLIDEHLLGAVKELVQLYLPSDKSFNRKEKKHLCFKRLDAIADLEENWDGYGASTVSVTIINNCKDFISSLPNRYLKALNIENIISTPNGTVILEWENELEHIVSIEIGTKKSAYFAELPDGSEPYSEDLILEKEKTPSELLNALHKLYLLNVI